MQRHPLDVVSLVFGLLYAAIATIALTDVVRFTGADVRWLGPGLLVLVGLVLVLTAGLGRRRSGAADAGDGREPGSLEPDAGQTTDTEQAMAARADAHHDHADEP